MTQPALSPLGPLGLCSQHTQPKICSFPAHFRPSLTALSFISWVDGPQPSVANPPPFWNGRWSGASPGLFCVFWTLCLLVTQCPTHQIAALYSHWCRMRQGLTSTAFLSGSSFPIPTLRPAKLVTWQPVIPNGRNPLALPGANSNPTTVRPGAALGYPNRARMGSAERMRQSDGGGSSY